jgi:hypothetical protein
MGGGCPGPIRSGAPMSAHTYAYTLTPGGPTGARSFAIIAAAIMAVGVLSSVPVMRELVGSAPARATTAVTALASDFQSRWWPGETQRVTRQASTMPERQPSTVPESDLTFAKGYSLRLAARQAASATRPVSGPSSESQFGRSAIVVRNATTVARADGAPNLRRVPALVDRPGPLDSGSHALAFGEQRPSPRAFAEPQGGPFASLFGNLR